MSSPLWHNHVWNYQVHQRFGESLYYFLVDLKPVEMRTLRAHLESFILEKELGGLRVFVLFGEYDLMIRAWLHPSVAHQLPGLLDGRVPLNDIQVFAATRVHRRWYESELASAGKKYLDMLDEREVRKVQGTEDQELLSKMKEHRLVIPRLNHGEPLIKFFVTATFETDKTGIVDSAVRDIQEHLTQCKELQNVSVYSGFGFATILITAHVRADDYFKIGKLPQWIAERFKGLRCGTETYLGEDVSSIAGDGTIGDATFRQLGGKDLLVQSILPELYEGNYSPTTQKQIESFAWNNLRALALSADDRNLLHDSLLGVIDEDPAQTAKTLLIFFVGLEAYLRRSLGEYVGRSAAGSLGKLMQRADMSKKDSKHLALGDILTLYGMTVPDEIQDAVSRARPLVDVRNLLAHEGTDVLEHWEDQMGVLVKSLSAVRQLVAHIEAITTKIYKGEY